jgi:hypothetical protein
MSLKPQTTNNKAGLINAVLAALERHAARPARLESRITEDLGMDYFLTHRAVREIFSQELPYYDVSAEDTTKAILDSDVAEDMVDFFANLKRDNPPPQEEERFELCFPD